MIRRIQKDEIITSDFLNKIVDELNRVGNWQVSGGLKFNASQGGNYMSVNLPQGFKFGLVKANGPNGEADYNDSRYWVNRCYSSTKDSSQTSEGELIEYPKTNPNYEYITAMNVADERPIGAFDTDTRSISAGAYVIYWSTYDLSTPPELKYYFDSGGGGGVVPVTCLKDGGADGTNQTPPTYSYTISNYSTSVQLATGVQYVGRMITVGSFMPGNFGLAFRNNGTWLLAYCNEGRNINFCGT